VLASHVWQQSLEQPYAEWLETRFRAPLGLQTLVAESDISGVQVGSSYAYLPARDWAKVGGLWLDAWHGRSGLLPQGWMTSSVQPRASDRRGRYGRGFWLNTAGVNFPALPESLFYASGNAGQYLVVVPEWELVVVRLGLTSPKARSGVQQLLRDLAALHRSGSLDDIHAEMAREAG
jgi:CubicO group peptidase (beta-lactamase class C family)